MIDPVSFLVFILLVVGLSQASAPRSRWGRLFWIAAPGMVLLFIVHPAALTLAVVSFLASTAVFLLGRLAAPRLRTRIPYLILALLFVPDLSELLREEPLLWLGSAFYIVRQMMTVAQCLKRDSALSVFLPALTVATFFFAALPSGPVYDGLRCWQTLGESRPADHREGLYRLFEGFVWLFAVAGFLSLALDYLQQPDGPFLATGAAGFLAWLLLAQPLAAFGFLFATFYGYSRMAEGAALLLGFEVPRNFDKPHLARDLGDFWKRWHRSMADFVMQYIYLPLLVTSGRTKLALIAAFTFMGLWHQISLSFLIWGLGHGIGLAALLPWARARGFSPAIMRVGSLTYVIWLSAIAHGVWQL